MKFAFHYTAGRFRCCLCGFSQSTTIATHVRENQKEIVNKVRKATSGTGQKIQKKKKKIAKRNRNCHRETCCTATGLVAQPHTTPHHIIPYHTIASQFESSAIVIQSGWCGQAGVRKFELTIR